MTDKYTVRRTAAQDYAVEAPDGIQVLTFTSAEVPDVPDDLAPDLVQYAEANGQSGIIDVLDMVLTGFRYIDGTR